MSEDYSYIHTTEELNDALAEIYNFDKGDRSDEYDLLCQALLSKQELLKEFFSQEFYTWRHCELATQLYLKVGKQVYLDIKEVMPNDIGKMFGNWDEFMLSQISKLSYAVKHRKGSNDTFIEEAYTTLTSFGEDLKSICDDALYTEMMCKIARTNDFWVDPSLRGEHGWTLDKEKYVITYDFMKSRYPFISHTNRGMHRFTDLLEALADNDYDTYLKAWGDFYYLFEDVYRSNPPKQSFTGEMYHILLEIPQKQTGKPYEEIIDECKAKLTTAINDNGWLYLHHAFEINTSKDCSLDLIYQSLSDEDKKKADQAKKGYLRRPLDPPKVQSHRNSKQKGAKSQQKKNELYAEIEAVDAFANSNPTIDEILNSLRTVNDSTILLSKYPFFAPFSPTYKCQFHYYKDTRLPIDDYDIIVPIYQLYTALFTQPDLLEYLVIYHLSKETIISLGTAAILLHRVDAFSTIIRSIERKVGIRFGVRNYRKICFDSAMRYSSVGPVVDELINIERDILSGVFKPRKNSIRMKIKLEQSINGKASKSTISYFEHPDLLDRLLEYRHKCLEIAFDNASNAPWDYQSKEDVKKVCQDEINALWGDLEDLALDPNDEIDLEELALVDLADIDLSDDDL